MSAPRTDVALLKHYRLKEPFPTRWTDPIEDAQAQSRKLSRKSTARYSILQQDAGSLSRLAAEGAQAEDSVPTDEPDPLGTAPSVVRALRKRGIKVEDNPQLRNHYLVSSKTFSPTDYLRDVHASSSTADLQRGSDFLSNSISQKSGSLKVLVEANFDRFVAAKSTIEGVYKEMKDASFMDGEFESEYGVGRIRSQLNQAGTMADDIFGPAMKGRGREESLRSLLHALQKHRSMMELPGHMADAARRKDYETIVEDYQKARLYLAESRALVPQPVSGTAPNAKEEHLQQLVIAEKMWLQVEYVLEGFKREIWEKLDDCKAEDQAHLELIGILLELGVDRSPISVWLFGRLEYLRARILKVFERCRADTKAKRRKVVNGPLPSASTIAHNLRSPSRRLPAESQKILDTPIITAFWELLYRSLSAVLSSSSGIVGELLTFWKIAQSFIDNDNLLPAGIDDQSRKYHRLSDDDVQALRTGAVDLVTLIRKCLVSFFQEEPSEDTSLNYCEGESSYLFFAPGSNSLGGVYYLSKVMVLLGSAAVVLNETFSPFAPRDLQEKLRSMISAARERAVGALTSAWAMDSQKSKVMEDWKYPAATKGYTSMPGCFCAFEKEVMGGMQAIVYLDKVRNSDASVIPPPSTKLLTTVRSSFVRSLYKALSGMVDNAKKQEDPVRPSTATGTFNVVEFSPGKQVDKKVRMLLTLSNLQLLKSDIVPDLISHFETSFSVKLTDEAKSISDALRQIEAQLFDEYTAPIVREVAQIVQGGILSPSWSPPAGTTAGEVKSYIYDALLVLVSVHAQVTTTAPPLVSRMLSYFLEELSHELLEGIRHKKTFRLGELLQATLDVEFVNQTLSQFSTPKASEWQQLVYVELDRGSDAEARQGLQKELGEMKRILSQLRRYSRAEFLCFRAKKSSSRRTNAHTEP